MLTEKLIKILNNLYKSEMYVVRRDKINQSLTAIISALREEVEGMKIKNREYISPFEEKQHLRDIGRNQALDDLLKKLE